MPRIYILHNKSKASDIQLINSIANELDGLKENEVVFSSKHTQEREERIINCDIVLVVLNSPLMLSVQKIFGSGIFNHNNNMRTQLRIAMRTNNKCKIIPILLNTNSRLSASVLPTEFKQLAISGAVNIHENSTFSPDMDDLKKVIAEVLKFSQEPNVGIKLGTFLEKIERFGGIIQGLSYIGASITIILGTLLGIFVYILSLMGVDNMGMYDLFPQSTAITEVAKVNDEQTLTWTPSPTQTHTPSPTHTNTSTWTPVPTQTDTPVPIWTPVPTQTDTPVPTWTPLPTQTDTSVPTWTPAPTQADTPVPTWTPLPTQTDTPVPTWTPLPTQTDTSVPTWTPAPTQADTPVPTWTPLPTQTDTPLPTGGTEGFDRFADLFKPSNVGDFSYTGYILKSQYFDCYTRNPDICQDTAGVFQTLDGFDLPIVNISWQHAQNYCSEIGGGLPSIEELGDVVIENPNPPANENTPEWLWVRDAPEVHVLTTSPSLQNTFPTSGQTSETVGFRCVR